MLLAVRRCKGTSLNPIEWLDVVGEDELRIWRAYDRIEPMGEEWTQTVMLARLLDGLRLLYSAAHGEKADPIEADDLMPPRWLKPKMNQASQTPEEIQQTMIAALGGNEKHYGIRKRRPPCQE